MKSNVIQLHAMSADDLAKMLNDILLDDHHESIGENRADIRARHAGLISDMKARRARLGFRVVAS